MTLYDILTLADPAQNFRTQILDGRHRDLVLLITRAASQVTGKKVRNINDLATMAKDWDLSQSKLVIPSWMYDRLSDELALRTLFQMGELTLWLSPTALELLARLSLAAQGKQADTGIDVTPDDIAEGIAFFISTYCTPGD